MFMGGLNVFSKWRSLAAFLEPCDVAPAPFDADASPVPEPLASCLPYRFGFYRLVVSLSNWLGPVGPLISLEQIYYYFVNRSVSGRVKREITCVAFRPLRTFLRLPFRPPWPPGQAHRARPSPFFSSHYSRARDANQKRLIFTSLSLENSSYA